MLHTQSEHVKDTLSIVEWIVCVRQEPLDWTIRKLLSAIFAYCIFTSYNLHCSTYAELLVCGAMQNPQWRESNRTHRLCSPCTAPSTNYVQHQTSTDQSEPASVTVVALKLASSRARVVEAQLNDLFSSNFLLLYHTKYA